MLGEDREMHLGATWWQYSQYRKITTDYSKGGWTAGVEFKIQTRRNKPSGAQWLRENVLGGRPAGLEEHQRPSEIETANWLSDGPGVP